MLVSPCYETIAMAVDSTNDIPLILSNSMAITAVSRQFCPQTYPPFFRTDGLQHAARISLRERTS